VELARTVSRHAAKDAAPSAAVQWSRPETRLHGTSGGRLHGASLGAVHQRRINGRSTIIAWSPLRVFSYFDPPIGAETVEVP